jgi:hypothetical protein
MPQRIACRSARFARPGALRLAEVVSTIAAMTESTAAARVKPRITHAAQQRWLEAALGFIQDGQTTAYVEAWLQEEGCTPRLRQELIGQALARLRGQRRGAGLRLVAIGAGLAALGGGLLWMALVGMHPPDDGRMHNMRLVIIGAIVSATAFPFLAFGAWAALTGRLVDPTTRLG